MATDTIQCLFQSLAEGRRSQLVDWSCKNQAVIYAPERVLLPSRKRKRDAGSSTSAVDSHNKIMIVDPKSTCTSSTIRYTPKHVATLPTSNFHNSSDGKADQAFWDERGKHLATLDNTGKFVLWGAPHYTNVWRALGAVDAGSRVIKFKWLKDQDEYVSNSVSMQVMSTSSNTSRQQQNGMPIDLTDDDDSAFRSTDSTKNEPLFIKALPKGPRGPSIPSKPGRLDGFVVITEDGKIILYFQDASNVVRFFTATMPGMEKSSKPDSSVDDDLSTPNTLTHADVVLADSNRMFLVIYGRGTSEKCIWTYDVEVDIRTETMHLHPSAIIPVAALPFLPATGDIGGTGGVTAEQLHLANELPSSPTSSLLSLHALNPRTIVATFGRLPTPLAAHDMTDSTQQQKAQGAVCVWELIETDAPAGDDGGVFGQDRDAKIITWALMATHASLTSFPTTIACLQPWHNPILHSQPSPGNHTSNNSMDNGRSGIKSLIAVGYADGTLELRDSKSFQISSLYEYRFGPLKAEKDLPPSVKNKNANPNSPEPSSAYARVPAPSLNTTSAAPTGGGDKIVAAPGLASVMIREDEPINDMMDWSTSVDNFRDETTNGEKIPDKDIHGSILGLAVSPNGVDIMVLHKRNGQVELDIVPMIERTTLAEAADPDNVIAELARQMTLAILNNADAQDLVDVIQVLTFRLHVEDLSECVMERVYGIIGNVLRPSSSHIPSLFPHPEVSDMNIEGRVVGMQLLVCRSIPGRQTQYSTTYIMIQLYHILKTFFQCCTDFWEARTTLFKIVKERSCIDLPTTPITMRKEFLHYFLPMARWAIDLVCLLLREMYMTIHIRRRKPDGYVSFQTPTMNNAPTLQVGLATPGGLASPPSIAASATGDDTGRNPWKGDMENQDLAFWRPTRLVLLFHTPSRRLIMAVLLAVRIFRLQVGINIASVKNQYSSAHSAGQTPQRQKFMDQLRNDAAYLQRAELVLTRARLKIEVALSFLFDVDDVITRPPEVAPPVIISGVHPSPPDIVLNLHDRKAAYDKMMIRCIIPPSYSCSLPYIRHRYDSSFVKLFSPVPQRPTGAQGNEQPQPEMMTNISTALMMFATDQTWMELQPTEELDPFNEFYLHSNYRNIDQKEAIHSYLETLRHRFDVISKANFWFAKGIRQCNRCCHMSACDVDTGGGGGTVTGSDGSSRVRDSKRSPLSQLQISFKGKDAPWGGEYDAVCVCGGTWKRMAVSQ
ncbi:hypothetical protein SeMB42_g00709 [Synchytrium endobioticum]|uniref:Mediator complex subunit 16 n=1 Tax=Synchytrium endobioticum TaxID=286115 RepID=A0A507D7L8_9FUNG|nr:hypothetical protein SeLEV6574_g02650 [Synchytrium endobioticum]TPX53550.1 hypothetical protein SeMB42_g00709 [Synchytrium endobioticum]